MSQTFDPRVHVRVRYSQLSQSDPRHAAFENWITGMTMERDGEYGEDRIVDDETIPGFWSWIQAHNATPEFQENGLFGTFIWFHHFTGHPVATGTIAPDDRGVKAEYNLGGDGLWGGVNVLSCLRNRGLGRRVVKELDDHVTSFATTHPRLFHLFTANPIAESMYLNVGYERNPIGDINTKAFGGERLYSKHYGAI